MSLSHRAKLSAFALLTVLGFSGYYLYDAFSTQGVGDLAQAPLNIESQVTPSFIMAVDDSGSMSFHNQFPASDGYACWQNGGSASTSSFFSSVGVLRTSGTVCIYSYSYTGPRIGTGYYGIPPVDNYGFARSPDFNPAYFNPGITYEPWLDATGKAYNATTSNPDGNASVTATLIDPRDDDTINLASQLEDANSRSRFQAYTNMFLPAGTRYRLTDNSNSCGGLSGGGWQTVGSNGQTLTSSCAIYVGYWPATFYLRSSTVPAGYGSVERTEIANACGSGCSLWRYRIQSKDTAALQNFANWYSYYGNRNRAMIAGMTRSMSEVSNMYVSYFTINGYGSWDEPISKSGERLPMRDMSSGTDRASLYSSMISLPASGGTPNRQAVNAAGLQFTRSDSGAPIKLECQKNAVMLFTDGYSNGGSVSVGNVDGGMGVPFADGNSNTMADIATRYYLNTSSGNSPLRSDLAKGKVPVPSACPSSDPSVDCQTNLHINFYGVTLGGRGNLYDPDTEQNAYTDSSVYNNWPSSQDNNRSTVDDIWHAATNTRGEFINARTPAEIVEAMRRILASVGAGQTPSGSIALTGSRIGAGSLTVVPFYESTNNSTDWYGKLTAQTVSRDTSNVLTYSTLWEASNKLPQASARSIYYGTASGMSLFNAGNVSLDNLCSNTTNSMSRCTASRITSELKVNLAQAIAYLRGDPSLEGNKDTPLRTRTTRLGDIVNSTPVISAPTDDYGFRSLYDASTQKYDAAGYAAYLKTKASRSNMVYVGANDGMLHAFNGTTGVEQFAYIPQTVLGHMGNLLFPYRAEDKDDQDFQHRYYVDGPVTVSDVAYSSSSWATVLVGTPGAGGKGAFALDVTTPTSFSRLWEINDRNSDSAIASNIGNVLGKPVIVPVRNTSGVVSWKAIFGNGYGSTNGKAVLFVVDVKSGKVTLLPAAETGVAGSNGLGNVVVLDRWGGSKLDTQARDGYADTVYAADQKGAVWKFDLRSMTADPTSTRTLATVTTPMFVAKDDADNRQPIIGGLQVAAGSGGGVMVYFGTGAFSFKSDAADKTQQTLYGVLDRASAAVTTALSRADLMQQKITGTQDGARTTTALALAAGKLGWYLDLTDTGERFVGNPEIENGIVFFPTFQPNTTDSCGTGGTNWLYGLNSLTGGAALSNVRVGSLDGKSYATGTGAVALATAGSAPVKDVAVASTARLFSADPESDPGSKCSMVIQASGASPLYMPRACGRQSWRQIR